MKHFQSSGQNNSLGCTQSQMSAKIRELLNIETNNNKKERVPVNQLGIFRRLKTIQPVCPITTSSVQAKPSLLTSRRIRQAGPSPRIHQGVDYNMNKMPAKTILFTPNTQMAFNQTYFNSNNGSQSARGIYNLSNKSLPQEKSQKSVPTSDFPELTYRSMTMNQQSQTHQQRFFTQQSSENNNDFKIYQNDNQYIPKLNIPSKQMPQRRLTTQNQENNKKDQKSQENFKSMPKSKSSLPTLQKPSNPIQEQTKMMNNNSKCDRGFQAFDEFEDNLDLYSILDIDSVLSSRDPFFFKQNRSDLSFIKYCERGIKQSPSFISDSYQVK